MLFVLLCVSFCPMDTAEIFAGWKRPLDKHPSPFWTDSFNENRYPSYPLRDHTSDHYAFWTSSSGLFPGVFNFFSLLPTLMAAMCVSGFSCFFLGVIWKMSHDPYQKIYHNTLSLGEYVFFQFVICHTGHPALAAAFNYIGPPLFNPFCPVTTVLSHQPKEKIAYFVFFPFCHRNHGAFFHSEIMAL